MIVACVEWGDYLGRGAEYVRKLRSMVARHLKNQYVFQVLTDSVSRHWLEYRERPEGFDIAELPSGKSGWWNKVALFQPRMFPRGERILFLDLDVVVTGDLAPLVETKGIIHLAEWGWQRNVYGSGVMVWDHGEHEEIWTRYTDDVPRRFEGDQNWIHSLGGWAALSPVLLRSYRYHCKNGVPEGCAVVSFHGKPKPHEVRGGWVEEGWR